MLSEKDFKKTPPVDVFCKCATPDLSDSETCKTCGLRVAVIEKKVY